MKKDINLEISLSGALFYGVALLYFIRTVYQYFIVALEASKHFGKTISNQAFFNVYQALKNKGIPFPNPEPVQSE